MSIQAPNSDSDLLDLLRIAGPLSVVQLADAMEVTATAVRQRLTRLISKTMIEREAVRAGADDQNIAIRSPRREFGPRVPISPIWRWPCGRNSTKSRTKKCGGRCSVGSLAPWPPAMRKRSRGRTPAERIRSLGDLLAQRRIPVSVEGPADQPSLTAHACPYPSLADSDRNVCLMEKMLFSELIGGEVELTRCRLDGNANCQFQTT